MSEPTKVQTKAEIIVDGLLDAVDRVGRFEGKGRRRKLMLASVMDRDTKQVRSSYVELVAWVHSQLDEAASPTAGDGGKGVGGAE